MGLTYDGTNNQMILFCNNCTSEISKVELTDAIGRIVHSSTFEGQSQIINSAELAKGYYFVRITTENQVFKSKILIY